MTGDGGLECVVKRLSALPPPPPPPHPPTRGSARCTLHKASAAASSTLHAHCPGGVREGTGGGEKGKGGGGGSLDPRRRSRRRTLEDPDRDPAVANGNRGARMAGNRLVLPDQGCGRQ